MTHTYNSRKLAATHECIPVKLDVFFCDGCGDLRPQAGRRYKKFGRRVCWFCAECGAQRKPKPMARARLYAIRETSGAHHANNNSTPRLPGSRDMNKPMLGAAELSKKVKVTVLPTPPERFAVPDKFVGAFQLLGVGRYIEEK